MKKPNGITLIALVITIIVLLILAGVSLSLVLGENGILNQAKIGVEKHRDASEKELITLGFSAYKTAQLTGQAVSKPDVEGATVTENGEDGWIVDFDSTGNSYKLDPNGTIEPQESFNASGWDETASDEDCFVWASDDPSSEDYGTIVGYTQKAGSNTLLRYPSRTKKITFNYSSYTNKFNGADLATARAFTNNVRKIEIPQTVTELGASAFDGYSGPVFVNVEEISVPNSVKIIGPRAFQKCKKIKTVTIPYGVTSLGEQAFDDCTELTNIVIPNSVTTLESNVFRDCPNLTNITIPDGIVSVGAYAFDDCAWTNTQPDGLIYVGKVLYKYKGNMPANTIINIKEGTTEIADHAFRDCSNLKGVTIPNSLNKINGMAFYNCTGLENIELPNRLTTIGSQAFQKCSSLNELNIPNTVTSIGAIAFGECTNITKIIIPNSVIKIDNVAFYKWTSNQTIYARAESQPSNWIATWNGGNANLIWGYTGD